MASTSVNVGSSGGASTPERVPQPSTALPIASVPGLETQASGEDETPVAEVSNPRDASDSGGDLDSNWGFSSSSDEEVEATGTSAGTGQSPSAGQDAHVEVSDGSAAVNDASMASLPTAGAAGNGKSSSSSDDETLLAVEAQSLKKWRDARDLTDDADFAFWFESFEQAKSAAGFVVAKAWRQIRACQMLGIARSVSDAFEGEVARATPLPEPTDHTRLAFRPGKTSFKATRAVDQSLLAEKKPPKPEIVSALKDCILAVGGMEEPGVDQEMRERAADRLIAAVSKRSEPETLQRAARTWAELVSHANLKGVAPHRLGRVSLDDFVHNNSASSRAYTALRWMSRNLQLVLPVDKIKPPSGSVQKGALGLDSDQAPVVLPTMLGELEAAIAMAHKSASPTVLSLVSQWLMAFGNMRLRHLKRSSILRVSRGWLHCFCKRGKQRHNRSGFDWACPTACITMEFDIAEEILIPAVKALPAGADAGLVFDLQSKLPLSNQAVIAATQQALQHCVANVADLSSYSWRRVCATVGHKLQFTEPELLALGDWQDRSAKLSATTPLRYSLVKYTASMRAKAEVHAALSQVWAFSDWDAVPLLTWDQLRSSTVVEVSDLLTKDTETLMRTELMLARQPRRLIPRAEEAGSHSAEVAALRMVDDVAQHASTMPVVSGKLLTSQLRSGHKLCGDFQTNSCSFDASECPKKHQCAVMLRSGRACGDPRHGAVSCSNRKFAVVNPAVPQAEQLPTVQPQTVPQPVTPVPVVELVPAVARAEEGKQPIRLRSRVKHKSAEEDPPAEEDQSDVKRARHSEQLADRKSAAGSAVRLRSRSRTPMRLTGRPPLPAKPPPPPPGRKSAASRSSTDEGPVPAKSRPTVAPATKDANQQLVERTAAAKGKSGKSRSGAASGMQAQ